MKNSAIEAMIRKEENLADEDQVDVEFIAKVGNEYEFKVTCHTTEPDRTITTLVNIESHTLSVKFS